MRDLTDVEIEKFASRAGVKRIAVVNFLGTLDERAGAGGNLYNATNDAISYRWNTATRAAIREGINLAFRA